MVQQPAGMDGDIWSQPSHPGLRRQTSAPDQRCRPQRSEAQRPSSPICAGEPQAKEQYPIIRRPQAVAREPHDWETPTRGTRSLQTLQSLALQHMHLVRQIATSYMGRHVPLDDLLQEGYLALWQAAELFDGASDHLFAPYAISAIQRALQRAVDQEQHAESLDAIMADARGEAPLRAGLARRGCVVRTTCRTADADPTDQWIHHAVVANMLCQALRPRERLVLALRFGIDGEPPHNRSEVARVMGVTRERARQIEERALNTLRHAEWESSSAT